MAERARSGSASTRLSAAAESGLPISSRCWLTIPAPAPDTAYPSRCCRWSSRYALSPSASALRCPVRGRSVVAIGGAIIGAGVAAMHYTGMAALELPAYIVWSPGIVLASIVFGSVFAALAMLVAVRRDDSVHTLAAAGLLTVAIVSHHFTAMGAVTLVPDPTLGSDALTVSPAALSFLTSVGAFAILGISLLAAMFDRRAKGELHEQKILLDSAHHKHVAGTLHVRCGRPHPAVQPALRRTHGPVRHAAAGPLAD